MKRLLFLLFTLLLSACTTTKKMELQEDNKFIVDLNDSIQMELTECKYDFTSYKGYSSFGMNTVPLVDLKWKVLNSTENLNIRDNLNEIHVHFYHKIDKRFFEQQVSLMDIDGKIVSPQTEILEGIFLSGNDDVNLIYTYNKDSIPYRISNKKQNYDLPINIELKDEIIKIQNKNDDIDLFLDSVIKNNFEDMKKLVEIENVDVNSTVNGKPSALLIASANGNILIADYLINAGSNPYKEEKLNNIRPHLNPISAAVYFDNEIMLDMFIEHDLNINCIAGIGWTPLLVAVEIDNVKLFSKLIENGADTDAELIYVNSNSAIKMRELAENRQSINVLQYMDEHNL